jgi:hypothetical protein
MEARINCLLRITYNTRVFPRSTSLEAIHCFKIQKTETP